MPFSSYIGLIWRRRKLLGVCALAAATLAVIDWQWNRIYEAKSVLLIQKSDNAFSGIGQNAAGKTAAMMAAREQFDRYLRFLKSRPFLLMVAERVLKHPESARYLKKLQPNELRTSSRSNEENTPADVRNDESLSRLGRAIASRLSFSSGQVGTLEIAVRMGDAKSAIDLASLVLQAAIDFLNDAELKELMDSKRYLTLKRAETEALLGEIDKSYLELNRHSDLPVGYKGVTSGGGLEEFQQAKVRLSENQKVIERLNSQLADLAQKGASKQATDRAALASARKELDTLSTKKATLLAEGFAANSHQMRMIEAQIASARERLKQAETQLRSAGEEKGEPTWNWEGLSRRMKQLRQENLYLEARIQTLNKILKPDSMTESPAARSRKIEYLQKRADLQYLFYSELTKRLFDIDIRRIAVEHQLVVLEPPSRATLRRYPSLPRTMAMAIFFALVGGIALAFQIEQSNPLLLDDTDVEALSVKVVGYVPDLASSWGDRRRTKSSAPMIPARMQPPDSREALIFKHLRTKFIQLIDRSERKVKLVTITSAGPGDGKSFVTLNTALALTKLGKRVLLIDADLRARRLTANLAPLAEEGLATQFGPNEQLAQAVISNCYEKVDFIGAGALPDDPSEFFTNPSFAIVLKSIAEKYDFVFIDTPPAIEYPDAATVSATTDATIVVGCSGRTRLKHFAAMVEQLSGSAPLLWAVLNKARGPYTKMAPFGSFSNSGNGRSSKAA